jgi:sec-independent protein translocase protein TatA
MGGNFGMGEILIVLVFALIILGPKRLPEVARSVGKGVREFKTAISMDDDDREQLRDPDGPRPSQSPDTPA